MIPKEERGSETILPERRPPSPDLKERINNLLWVVLPDNTTLAEAEEIAIHWWDDICKKWSK